MASASRKPNLFLHIGTPKTGTTSLQWACALNRSKLKSRGVLYPKSLGHVNHTKLAFAFSNMNVGSRLVSKRRVKSRDEQLAYRKKLVEKLRKEVQAADNCDKVFVSNEHMFSRMKRVDQLIDLRDALSGMFEDIEIFVHLRPQVDLLVSNASELARMGRKIDADRFDARKSKVNSQFLNYDRSIRQWENVFGLEAVRVVPYQQFPDTVEFYKKILGVELEMDEETSLSNPALSVEAIAYSNALLEHYARSSKPVPKRHYETVNRLGSGEKLKIGIDAAKAITEEFKSSNVAMCARHGLDYAQALEPNYSKYDEAPNLATLKEASAAFDAVLSSGGKVAGSRPLFSWADTTSQFKRVRKRLRAGIL